MSHYSKKIRLSDHDLKSINQLFRKHFLENDHLWIFGSRADLSKKGGDIDIYVETNINNLDNAIDARASFAWDLEQEIGEQKIDIVLNILYLKDNLPIYEVAKKEGVQVV